MSRTKLKRMFLKKKYADHADHRSMNWDWSQIPYNRIAVVNKLLSNFKDPSYLEIGCHVDTLFHAVSAINKVGVDPVSGGNVRATSDDFFEKNKETFDVIFIDGLHTYEQVRKDVINAIKCLKPNGWIALHDMLPRDWLEQHVPRLQGMWTGDVWKVAFEINNTDGIDFNILKLDHGVGVLKLNKPDIEFTDMTFELAEKQFSYFCDNMEKLPIIEWHEAHDWING